MKRILIYLLLFSSVNLFSQNNIALKLFEINNGNSELTKNVKIKKGELLITIYYIHGFISLTELHHYIINSQNNVEKYIEKQSRDKKLVSFEQIKMTLDEKKLFLKKLNNLLKSKFITFHPKEFYYENPDNKFRCGGNSDMPTKGMIISNLDNLSNYKSYDGYHKLQFCDLIHKENLKEFLDIYRSFEFKTHNFN